MKVCSLRKLTISAAADLVAFSLSPGSAQAACAPGTPAGTCRVTVGGLQYDVTTFTGTYNADTSKFAQPPAAGMMPWWGSSSLASQFSTAGGNCLLTQKFSYGPGSLHLAQIYMRAKPHLNAEPPRGGTTSPTTTPPEKPGTTTVPAVVVPTPSNTTSPQ